MIISSGKRSTVRASLKRNRCQSFDDTFSGDSDLFAQSKLKQKIDEAASDLLLSLGGDMAPDKKWIDWLTSKERTSANAHANTERLNAIRAVDTVCRSAAINHIRNVVRAVMASETTVVSDVAACEALINCAYRGVGSMKNGYVRVNPDGDTCRTDVSESGILHRVSVLLCDALGTSRNWSPSANARPAIEAEIRRTLDAATSFDSDDHVDGGRNCPKCPYADLDPSDAWKLAVSRAVCGQSSSRIISEKSTSKTPHGFDALVRSLCTAKYQVQDMRMRLEKASFNAMRYACLKEMGLANMSSDVLWKQPSFKELTHIRNSLISSCTELLHIQTQVNLAKACGATSTSTAARTDYVKELLERVDQEENASKSKSESSSQCARFKRQRLDIESSKHSRPEPKLDKSVHCDDDMAIEPVTRVVLSDRILATDRHIRDGLLKIQMARVNGEPIPLDIRRELIHNIWKRTVSQITTESSHT